MQNFLSTCGEEIIKGISDTLLVHKTPYSDNSLRTRHPNLFEQSCEMVPVSNVNMEDKYKPVHLQGLLRSAITSAQSD